MDEEEEEEEEEGERKRSRIRFEILCLLTFYQTILGHMEKRTKTKTKYK